MLIFKNSFRKIRRSLGRFLSLIFIVALGSAFFSGIREASMDMIKTVDEYYDDTELMDYKIVSTMGLTEGDLDSIREVADNLIVEPSYSFDLILDGDVTRIHAINDEINKVNLISGSMPKDGECLVEEGTYNIGDKIVIESDNLKRKEYKVSGTITSSLYMYRTKGISTVGDGKLDKYIFIPKENFDIEYYTEIYIIAKDGIDKIAYLEDYNEIISALDSKLKELKPIRETIRYEEILAEAMGKINDAEAELNKQKIENGQKLADAKKELDEGKNEIEKAYQEWQDGYDELQATSKEMERTFNNANIELEEGKKKFEATLKEYNLKESELETTLETLNTQIDSISALLETLDPNSQEYLIYQTTLKQLNENKSNLELLIKTKNTLEASEQELENNMDKWEREFDKAIQQLNDSYELIEQNEQELNEGYAEYEENYQTYLEEISKAEQEIEDAKSELNNLEKPVWYLMSREDNSGYTNFYENATKVDAIAAVFPVFFMLVVFLMSLNTMTRMIEEERNEIGIYVSLGISKFKIITSYLFYVLIATSIGLIIGLSIGYAFIPHIIYNIYHSNYIIPGLKTYAEVIPCLSIILVTLSLMIIVTLITILKDFKYVPATLLRPAPPKNGKKVILEKVKFIWKRLSFTWKVTIRNMFRYKKRIIMTLLGISGCTALLLTGFGLRDSVSSLVSLQYDNLHLYDSMLILDEEITAQNEEINNFLSSKSIDNLLYAHMESYVFEADSKRIDTYLLAFENLDMVDDYFKLKDLSGNPLTLTDDGVIITQKMAELLGAEVGEDIQIRNSENELFILRVAGICENYVNSYIYMTSNYYQKIFNEVNYNTIITDVNNDNHELLATELMDSGYFTTIQYTSDSLDMFNDIIDGMNNIIYLIIIASSLLAIIVLYNLTTININERKREIATLKVLGFKDKEVSTYVYRETLILTSIGIVIGLFLGVILNSFVLTIAETDEILFVKDIKPLSFVYAFAIMIFFTVLVQFITHFVLKKIDMIESLKSVE